MMRLSTLSLLVTIPCLAAIATADVEYIEASSGLQTPTMEAGNTEIEFGDVDADGHVDIVMIGDHGSPFINSGQHGVTVWRGDGTGAWSVVQTGSFGYGGVALGDVNGDGLLDVGYGMHHDYSGTDLGDQLLEVALGDGTATGWTPWDDGLATNGETWGMFGTDFADIDNDGDLDIGAVSFGCCAGIHVYRNNGDGTWTQAFGFVGGNSGLQFRFGDVDGDGNADLAASHGGGTVYLGDGNGDFALADGNLPGSAWRTGITLGDVNGDGRDDLAWTVSSGAHVWTRDANGTWTDLSGTLASIGAFDRTHIADMNLDGNGDLVVFRDELIRVYAGDGAGGWTLEASITTPDACDYSALRAGVDLDHNGYPDIAMIQEEDCQFLVGGTNRPRVYVEASIPAANDVTLVAPLSGATWRAGSVRFIDWHAALTDASALPPMTLELSTNGASGPWSTIATGLVPNGRFQWVVPAETQNTDNAFVRASIDGDAAASVAGPFTIVGGAERPPADLDGDGDVDGADLGVLLGSWGPCEGCAADLDGDGVVDGTDLGILLGAWGT